jgi:hypothetical protein
MDHPVLHAARVTEFLNQAIQECGEYLFVGFVFLCLIIIWIIMRRRRTTVHDIPVLILPLGDAPRHNFDREPSPFEEQPDD